MDHEMAAEFVQQSSGLVPQPRPTIAKLNFSHEAIIRWMLQNPEKNLGECAKAFNYTQGWLSIIIHSDAFQAKLRDLQGEADTLVIADIPAKLRGVASLALEGLAEQVEVAVSDNKPQHRDFLLKSSETVLKALGYGAKQTVNVHQHGGGNTANVVGTAALSRARDRLLGTGAQQVVHDEKLIGDGKSSA